MHERRHRRRVSRQSVGKNRDEEEQPRGQAEGREQNLVSGEQGAEKDAEEAEQRERLNCGPARVMNHMAL